MSQCVTGFSSPFPAPPALHSRARFNRFHRAGTMLKNYMQVLATLPRLHQISSHLALVFEDAAVVYRVRHRDSISSPRCKLPTSPTLKPSTMLAPDSCHCFACIYSFLALSAFFFSVPPWPLLACLAFPHPPYSLYLAFLLKISCFKSE
ncbi:hypothetical protein BV22DRAFT_679972 [Leucogyrophana mollusca]|uniref:Uncharacterized protein n=1 Tax=Leucogyrophana mollusca TaxID=85980 RepID=A0ACB8B9K4_9AGAM|nr:hypothetical protein BV22DRAFT_679972 [Leucogyrophana mollusca]